MKTTTAEQLVVLNRLIVDKKMRVEQIQSLLDGGYLSDLCDADLSEVDRCEFREFLGFLPLEAEGSSYLQLVSGAEVLELDETDGKETIAKAKKTFTGGIDSDFENYGTNVPSPATKKMKVAVHEMIKDGTFQQICGGMGADLDSFFFTQAQIIQFVKKYCQWLRTGGYATFFPFKIGDNRFVAYVYVDDDGQLEAYVHHFSYDLVWYAVHRPRFVLPQLAPSGT